MSSNLDFAHYCCELLSSVGNCKSRKMFGGFGISVDGMNIALVANLGNGDQLWLKTNPNNENEFIRAGSHPFVYTTIKDGVSTAKSLHYYSAPAAAMESIEEMRDWAIKALDAALVFHASKKPQKPKKSLKSTDLVKNTKAKR
jgi:DNA transformation protein